MDYFFFDLENVNSIKLEDIDVLTGKESTFCFLGNATVKIPLTVLARAQEIGVKIDFAQTQCTGKNALDFHIAVRIGELVALGDKNMRIAVISGDAGYDSVIEWLRESRETKIVRSKTVAGAIDAFDHPLSAPLQQNDDTLDEQHKSTQSQENVANKGHDNPLIGVLLILMRNVRNRQPSEKKLKTSLKCWLRKGNFINAYSALVSSGIVVEGNDGVVEYNLERLWEEVAKSSNNLQEIRKSANFISAVIDLGTPRPKTITEIAERLNIKKTQVEFFISHFVDFGFCQCTFRGNITLRVKLAKSFVKIFGVDQDSVKEQIEKKAAQNDSVNEAENQDSGIIIQDNSVECAKSTSSDHIHY